MSGTASIYMKAFHRDLSRIPVWEPGDSVDVADYGRIDRGQWLRLGSLTDLIPDLDQSLLATREARRDQLSLGAHHSVEAAGSGEGKAASAAINAKVRFGDGNSLMLRAKGCVTQSLERLGRLAEAIAAAGVWDRRWTLVTQVQRAESFVVVAARSGSGDVVVTAKSPAILDAFLSGTVEAGADLTFRGASAAHFVGRSGPISMNLVRIRGADPIDVRYSEGSSGLPPEVAVVTFDAAEFLAECERTEGDT